MIFFGKMRRPPVYKRNEPLLPQQTLCRSLQCLSELGEHLAAQGVAADATEREDAFEEAIVGLCNFDTDKDRDRAKEAVGIARLRLTTSTAKPNPDIVYVLEHEDRKSTRLNSSH